MHQYVVYDTTQAKRKGPRRINLDDPNPSASASKTYAPPTSLSVHLSKIDMPELQPRPESKVQRPPSKPQQNMPLDKHGFPDSKSALLAWEREQESARSNEKERTKERENQKLRDRVREKEMERARKKTEKEAKKITEGKKGASFSDAVLVVSSLTPRLLGSHSNEPEPNQATRPITPTPIPPYAGLPHINIPQHTFSYQPPINTSSSYQPPVNASSYPTELRHSASFSFPQPNARPTSSYYDSSAFITSPSALSPPPAHPSMSRTRPTSWYGSGSGMNTVSGSYGGASGYGYNSSYLRQ